MIICSANVYDFPSWQKPSRTFTQAIQVQQSRPLVTLGLDFFMGLRKGINTAWGLRFAALLMVISLNKSTLVCYEIVWKMKLFVTTKVLLQLKAAAPSAFRLPISLKQWIHYAHSLD